jgi:hypothetical protein
VPDAAGPHSAGRVSADRDAALVLADDEQAASAALSDPGLSDSGPGADAQRAGPVRQWAVLTRRNAEVLGRDRRMQAVLAGTPVAILLGFCVLLGCGSLDGRGAVTLAWAVLGGLVVGLAYQLPARAAEAGILRRERFAGLSTGAFVLAKVTVLLPPLALACVLILAVPAIDDHLTAGFGIAYLAVLLSSLAGLAIALALPVLKAVT